MADFDDFRLLSWYLDQVERHPQGIVPLAVAARMSGVTWDGMMDVCRRSKVRLLKWRCRKSSLYFVPLSDLIEWQAARSAATVSRERKCSQWPTFLNGRIKFQGARVLRKGDYLRCEACGLASQDESADVKPTADRPTGRRFVVKVRNRTAKCPGKSY